jgi:hypothetical protein
METVTVLLRLRSMHTLKELNTVEVRQHILCSYVVTASVLLRSESV